MRHIALLRGINVSGQKLIKMTDLKKHFEMPGYTNVVTYIQSGNVLFDTVETDEQLLRDKIERQLAEKLGYGVGVIVRSLPGIQQVIDKNPYSVLPEGDGRRVYVTFLSAVPDVARHQSLTPYLTGTEEFRIIDREVYLLFTSYGNTKLNNALIEKKLGVVATTRNWATVNKVIEL